MIDLFEDYDKVADLAWKGLTGGRHPRPPCWDPATKVEDLLELMARLEIKTEWWMGEGQFNGYCTAHRPSAVHPHLKSNKVYVDILDNTLENVLFETIIQCAASYGRER